MKVDELRVKLSNLEKDDIIKLAVEFYKLVPKAKKEDYDLDTLVNTPSVKKEKSSVKVEPITITNIEAEVKAFIVNAKAQNYIDSNPVIPRKERATWRFKVKAWYKELTNGKNMDSDIAKRAEITKDLYELLCESYHYSYFTTYDTFESVGISQMDFFQSVLILIEKSEGTTGLVSNGLGLIINKSYTMYSVLMDEWIDRLQIPEAKYDALELTKKMLIENKFKPQTTQSKKFMYYGNDANNEYRISEKNNNLAEMGFKLHISLLEYDEAIQFYKKHAYQTDNEVKLYILIRLLFQFRLKDYIKSELDAAVKQGERLRDSLLNLKKTIETKNALPDYIR